MTLLELCQLVRHYWKLSVCIPVACALAAALLSVCLPPKYEASASITVNDPSNNVPVASMVAVVDDLMQSRIAPYSTRDSEIQASAKVGTTTASQTVTLTIEGPDEFESVEIANDIASSVAEDARKVFESLQEASDAELADLSALNTSDDVASVLSGTILQDTLGPDCTFEFCSFTVTDAVEAENANLGLLPMLLVGLVGGFLLALFVVVVINMTTAPIRGRGEIEAALDLPVLNSGAPSSSGDKLWANIQFAQSGPIDSICLVPLEGGSAAICASELQAAISRTGRTATVEDVEVFVSQTIKDHSDALSIFQCKSLDVSAEAVYCAHAATVTVICAREWDDTLVALEGAVKELTLAKANVLGVALRAYGGGC